MRTCGSECLFMFWFLDAGMTNPSTRCGGRRPKTRTEADIVRADFPLSTRPASRPPRTAGLS